MHITFVSKRLSDVLAYILGALSDCIYVDIIGKDLVNCGLITKPCGSLSFTINNVSSHDDKICLIASPIKQIRYILENPIVIKHSLAVTKFPAYSLNPVITHHLNATSNWKEFYAFSIFQSHKASGILTLNIKSVNFNVNIFTTLSAGCKTLRKKFADGDTSGTQLSVSLSDSIIRSPCHVVSFIDLSGYENASFHLKDLVIENGDFKFENKRERCKPMDHIKNIIEMSNVTIWNTENAAISVTGCFNVSIEMLTCSNITWKRQEFLTFRGSVLNTENILIKNVFVNSNMKHNKTERKSLLLIYEGVTKIQNMLIKDIAGMSSTRPLRFSAVIIAKDSEVKILNLEVKKISFRYFAQADKSSLCFKNITLSQNGFTGMLWSIEESDLKLYEAKFSSNKIGYLVYINLNSNVLTRNNSFIGNKICKSAYWITKSYRTK